MDTSSVEKIEKYQWDARRALTDLLNLPGPPEHDDYMQANEAFERRYGKPRSLHAWHVANLFRDAWKRRDEPSGQQETNVTFGGILNDPIGEQRTAVHVNIIDQKVEIDPRDLLDALTVEFLRSYRKIAQCAGEGCSRLFIREYSRDSYCSTRCGDKARLTAQREWMQNYRAQQKQKKSKPRKTRRTA